MSKKIDRRRIARESIIEYAVYISSNSPEAGSRFLNSVENTLKALLSMPEMAKEGDFHEQNLKGIRVFPVKDFPNHLIFYRVTEEGIEVVDVIHGSRDLEKILTEGSE